MPNLSSQRWVVKLCVCVHVCAVVNGSRPAIHPHVPHCVRAIVTACWAQQPEQRPTFSDVCVMLADAIRQVQAVTPIPFEPGPTIADITEQKTRSFFF